MPCSQLHVRHYKSPAKKNLRHGDELTCKRSLWSDPLPLHDENIYFATSLGCRSYSLGNRFASNDPALRFVRGGPLERSLLSVAMALPWLLRCGYGTSCPCKFFNPFLMIFLPPCWALHLVMACISVFKVCTSHFGQSSLHPHLHS